MIQANNRLSELIQVIPRPDPDLRTVRESIARLISREWSKHLSSVPEPSMLAPTSEKASKARFIAEMYARACYSMLIIGSSAPIPLRFALWILSSAMQNRKTTVWLNSRAIPLLHYFIPRSIHRRIVLMSALMGTIDGVLDEAAPSGYRSALRIASMLTDEPEATTDPMEATLKELRMAIRYSEGGWRSEYWTEVILPAVREYCCAEVSAVCDAVDPMGLSFRWAGIDAAIKGMWYAIGPSVGVTKATAELPQPNWNPEQRWMADTSLLMQMIDDWSDQDTDRGCRQTPVIAGKWTPDSIRELYLQTVTGLESILNRARIHNSCLRSILVDLYRDYIHAAIEAMASGVAA